MTTPFRLSQFLPYRLAHVSERVSRRLAVQYESSHGLSVAEWRVLVNLQQLETASVRELQFATNLEKSRVSRAVARLEAAQLVRKKPSQSDARLVVIAMTELGRRTLSEIIPTATEVETRLLRGLSDAQLAAFFDVIEHFHTVLDADPKARPRKSERSSDL